MSVDPGTLEGGFADAPREAQATFRALLGALSEPGTIATVTSAARPPEPFTPLMGALALTLCDADTPVWLDAGYGEKVRDWLAYQTGAPIVRQRAEARLAFVSELAFEGFGVGDDAYPDRSATVVAKLDLAGGAELTLRGPGIERTRALRARVPDGFPAAWARNRALYPCGLDLILVDGDRLAALPRTTEVTCTSP